MRIGQLGIDLIFKQNYLETVLFRPEKILRRTSFERNRWIDSSTNGNEPVLGIQIKILKRRNAFPLE